jgi:predicted lipoprotein with Yx(FWY)xxD motif
VAGLALSAALVAAACSSGATPTAAVQGATSAAKLTLGSTNDQALGAYLTGVNGMTLYVLTTDTPDTTTCTGTCATNWPPLTVTSGETIQGPSAATGVFGTTNRPDGTTQVTYDHHPLYYYAGDSAAGDTKGQGLKGIWFVAPLSGTPSSTGSGASSAPAASSTASPYSGY